jgi:N-acetylmuramoyl-L-alanine amidase
VLPLGRRLCYFASVPRLISPAAVLALAAALLLSSAPSRAEGGANRALVVVIDPGHGGAHPHEGARGPNKLVEKTIALAVAKKLKVALEAEGATAILTRDDDVDLPLSARAMIANEADADLFLSIHCNSMATSDDRRNTQGAETYFLSPDPTDAEARMLAEMENGGPAALPVPHGADPVSGLLADLQLGQARTDSAQLAQIVQRTLVHTVRMASRGVRQAPFLVLSALKMPAALVEIGFISHPREGRQLGKDLYQQKLAVALAAGVRQFADVVLSRRLAADGSATVVAKAKAGASKAVPAAAAPPSAAAGVAVPAVAGLPATR